MLSDFMSALKTADMEGVDIERFEIVKSLLPSHVEVLDLKDVARSAPTEIVVNTKMERLNRFQIDLYKVVSLIMKNEIKESYALYKEAYAAFFSQDGEFAYDKNKDAFEYVNNHFEEFAKWFLSNWEKAK